MKMDHDENIFLSFIKDIYKQIWFENRSFICLLYSALKTIGFSELESTDELERYLGHVKVDMVYLKNIKSKELQLYQYELLDYEIKDGAVLLKLKNGKTVPINLGIGGIDE